MASREPVRLNSLLRSASSLVAAAVLLAPTAGLAAKLSQVRIGTHEDHTRIVLELDEAASYRLSPPGEGGTQLQIQLDADSAARHVASRSPLVKAVRVTPSARGATVFVDLSQSGVGVSEMILADPPRIVLDLSPTGSGMSLAARAVPVPTPAPPPAPEAARSPEPTPAAAPAPSPVAAPTKPPETPAAAEKPAPSLADPIPSDISGTPAGDETETAGADGEPAPDGAEDAQGAAPLAVAEAGSRDAEASGTPAGDDTDTGSASAEPAASASKKPAEVVVRKPGASAPATAASGGPTWVDRLLSPVGYAGIGVVLLALVVLAVRRRRHDEDDDPLYSVMSADDAGEENDGAHAAALAWNQDDDEAEGVEEETPVAAGGFFDDAPVDRDGSQQLSLSRSAAAGADTEETHAAEQVNDADSFFREPEASAPLPVSDEHAPSFQPEPGDVAHLAAELGQRVQELERRLEQLTEARERLERQVAAQTEELRVQRAAIARTQRVVRSMTKGEDLVTEPVPRAPQA